MPVDIFDAPSEPSYVKPSHSFAFGDGKASSSRKSRRSRHKHKTEENASSSTASGLDFDDDRVELYSGARPNASSRPRQKINSDRGQLRQSRSRTNSSSFAHWDDGDSVGATETSILASFPFHSSSFQPDNNDTPDVYDYDINDADLTKYTSPPHFSGQTRTRSNNHRGNLSAGSCRVSRAVDDDDIYDRPPSRQCHAFPTHLVDQMQFDDGGGDDGDHPPEEGRRSETLLKRRPPSRHKHLSASQKHIHDAFRGSCEINEQSLEDSIHRFRTRREMRRQSHDPTRDGFDPVDETVPLPFRIEVTTQNNGHATGGNQTQKAKSTSRRYRASATTTPIPSAAFDEMRRTLKSRAEDPVVVRIAPDRRSHLPRGAEQTPSQWLKDEPHPFFENTLAAQLPEWLAATSLLQMDSGPETNSDGIRSAGSDDLKLDDFNFSATPPAPPESSSLHTSLGVDFLSLFAQS
ncbi:hypothetical protein H310_03042 [Aphanomyces invadans]|uniref:Uncharacterized protein n=1 Tax=Aphanomyces invadans TaxID=157072 RepID=A0A024UKJ2_9STRA|nr:hypothetical protein H310_03042 [Aphanomyces invadans]ETW06931.1 hypothetical protein H310_03042 [Aphanomyces invadans]|eukprot:XP_008865006.1 hypothetical protein H310_03042 [Aphanomyces invadans]